VAELDGLIKLAIKFARQTVKNESKRDSPLFCSVKTDPWTGKIRKNNYGRPKLESDKSKVYY
jgi:hypothetical protein